MISEAYDLEYGTDCLEMHNDAVKAGERALVIDDLVATGGTLSAAIKLLGILDSFTYEHDLSKVIVFLDFAAVLTLKAASPWENVGCFCRPWFCLN